jgi:hypothetical protein
VVRQFRLAAHNHALLLGALTALASAAADPRILAPKSRSLNRWRGYLAHPWIGVVGLLGPRLGVVVHEERR